MQEISRAKVMVTYALCALALSEVINLNIVSVALPNLMGALGANIDNISLTMTSYMVAAAICMPLSGMVINKFGMRRVALIAIVIFTLFTILCGTATNLLQMVIYRTLQGIGGAFFPAMAQAYIVNNFHEEMRQKMMTILTAMLVSGVVVGPSFGGFLVQNMSWSWIFYVNLPLLIFAFIVIFFWMEETIKQMIKIDYISFTFMALGIGGLELFLDEGNTYMWFQSLPLTIVFALAVIFLIYFAWRAITTSSVINFKVFCDKNFSLCCVFLFFFYLVANAFMTYSPIVLQTVWGYQIDTAGYLLIPRGALCFVFAPCMLKVLKMVDSRLIMIFACLAVALCTGMFCYINTTPDLFILFLSEVLIAFASIAFMGTVYTTAYLKMPKELTNDAAGVFNFFRTFGGSVGASVTATIVTINQQVSWHDLSSKINHYNHTLKYIIANIGVKMSVHDLLITTSWAIAKQTNLLAFISVFVIFTILALLLCIVPVFMDSLPRNQKIEFGE